MLVLSRYLIPLMIFYIVGFGALSHRPVFDDFMSGAESGMKTVVKIMPTLIGLMTGVGFLRSSGLLNMMTDVLQYPAALLHIPAPVIPVILVRLFSSSAAIGLVLDLFGKYGPDSCIGLMASIMMSCTESVLYCVSIYFGSVHIRKTRYVMTGAMLATAAGVAASMILAGIL